MYQTTYNGYCSNSYSKDAVQFLPSAGLLEKVGIAGGRYASAKSTTVRGSHCSMYNQLKVAPAEMALATLQGVQIPGAFPPLRLVLSHTGDPEQPDSQSTLYPQFIEFNGANKPHIFRDASAQDVFRWFRNAGPLASVKVTEDVGGSQKTCILQYYKEEHARFAQSKCNLVHSALKSTGGFLLRTFIPNHLIISVSSGILQLGTCTLMSDVDYGTGNEEHTSAREIREGKGWATYDTLANNVCCLVR